MKGSGFYLLFAIAQALFCQFIIWGFWPSAIFIGISASWFFGIGYGLDHQNKTEPAGLLAMIAHSGVMAVVLFFATVNGGEHAWAGQLALRLIQAADGLIALTCVVMALIEPGRQAR